MINILRSLRDNIDYLCFEDYIKYIMYERKYSTNTIINYIKDLELYFSYLKDNKLEYKNMSNKDAISFLAYLTSKDYKKSSINRIFSSIKNFYEYKIEMKVITNNAFKHISLPKKDNLLPIFMFESEMNDLIELSDKNTDLEIRNLLIIEILYSTGIRVTELVNIKLGDINYYNKSILITGKNNKQRIVLFNNSTNKVLLDYVNNNRLKLLKNNTNSYLLLNKNGNNITTRAIRYIILDMLKKTNINKNISPHKIRHTFATHMLNNGADLRTIQEQLGHTNLSTSSIYTHVLDDYKKREYLNNHPRGNKTNKKERRQ